MRKLIIAGLMAGVALPMAPAAYAQAESDPGFSEDAIVVTARRREENLQDLPLSIVAMNADAMQAEGIYNIEQLGDFDLAVVVGSRVHGTLG